MDYKPQFIEFLQEITDNLKRISNETGNTSRKYQTYFKALKSLKASPDEFKTSKSLQKVDGIGKTISEEMEKWLNISNLNLAS
jgi:DNA polymerase/3'-5' exonuclease PolX